MYNLAIIRDVDFPQLKEMLQRLHKTFWLFEEVFNITRECRRRNVSHVRVGSSAYLDITMQKYYQAVRTLRRLGYMADLGVSAHIIEFLRRAYRPLVWQKLTIDRRKLEKMVSTR